MLVVAVLLFASMTLVDVSIIQTDLYGFGVPVLIGLVGSFLFYGRVGIAIGFLTIGVVLGSVTAWKYLPQSTGGLESPASAFFFYVLIPLTVLLAIVGYFLGRLLAQYWKKVRL